MNIYIVDYHVMQEPDCLTANRVVLVSIQQYGKKKFLVCVHSVDNWAYRTHYQDVIGPRVFNSFCTTEWGPIQKDWCID